MYNLQNIAHHQFHPQPSSPSPSSSPIYILALHRIQSTNHVAALTSDKTLSLLDPSRLNTAHNASSPSASPVVSSWAVAPQQQQNNAPVTVLRGFDGVAPGGGGGDALLCTAGEDGLVAVWDGRLRGEEARVARFKAGDAPILSMACSGSTHTIAVGTELKNHTASIILWDVRATPTPRVRCDEAHSDDVTTLAFHPHTPALLLSGSTDGLISLHDTRIADIDEVTLETLNHDAPINHAGFVSDELAYALSHDERFAIYDVSPSADVDADANVDAGPVSLLSGDLRSVLGCQYVADVTPKMDGSGAIIGAGSHDQQSFELVFLAKDTAGQPWMLDRNNSVGLPGAHGEELVRAFCFFDQEQLVLTGGEDGAVKAWGPGG